MVRICKCFNCEEKKETYRVQCNQIVGSFDHYYCFDCAFELGFTERD